MAISDKTKGSLDRLGDDGPRVRRATEVVLWRPHRALPPADDTDS